MTLKLWKVSLFELFLFSYLKQHKTREVRVKKILLEKSCSDSRVFTTLRGGREGGGELGGGRSPSTSQKTAYLHPNQKRSAQQSPHKKFSFPPYQRLIPSTKYNKFLHNGPSPTLFSTKVIAAVVCFQLHASCTQNMFSICKMLFLA